MTENAKDNAGGGIKSTNVGACFFTSNKKILIKARFSKIRFKIATKLKSLLVYLPPEI